jgi:hypothetical protein
VRDVSTESTPHIFGGGRAVGCFRDAVCIARRTRGPTTTKKKERNITKFHFFVCRRKQKEDDAKKKKKERGTGAKRGVRKKKGSKKSDGTAPGIVPIAKRRTDGFAVSDVQTSARARAPNLL